LLPLLKNNGFVAKPSKIIAMAKTLPLEQICNEADKVRTWCVDPKETKLAWRLLAEGFDVPNDVARIFHLAYMNKSNRQTSKLYAAGMPESNIMHGVAYLTFLEQGKSALMRVACIKKSSRNRGLYRALVKRRLIDAASSGASVVYAHAYSQGSYECLKSLGFIGVGELQLHQWAP
jgi:hypothetical protein